MRRSFLLLATSLIMAAAVVAACKQKNTAAQGDDAGVEGDDDDSNTTTGGGDDDDDAGADQGTAAVPSNGVPCDVQAVIENRCLSCHGTTAPQGPPLLKYDDFAAKGKDGTKTRGQLAAEYMKAKTMPKPPGVATDSEIATVDAWVTGGMKKSDEACILAPGGATSTNTGDAGAADAATVGVDAGLCTSNVRWTQANTKSPLMHPGGPCIGCHSTTQGGPALTFAGTVFPSLHEVDDCNGVSTQVTVVIKDRRNQTFTMQTNAAGNFMAFTETLTDLNLRPPFKVEVREPGKPARKMNQTITGGDCNSCHTVAGNGPPGRVLEPGAPLQ